MMMQPVVTAPNGTYLGMASGEGSVRFLGIPFAEAKRWQSSEPVKTTAADRICATSYGTAPMQPDGFPGALMPAGCGETCLNLNLFTSDLKKTGKAVLVWIYGGAQIGGSNVGLHDDNLGGREVYYDGTGLVAENPDILLVVPNYRVGMWGSVDLTHFHDYTDDYRCSNNLARLDLVQCLQWIQTNIRSFGGDPQNVTLMGQSAGSCNITTLLMMEQAQGLFQKVICQSSFALDISLTKAEDSKTVSRALFDQLGCETLQQALEKTPEELLQAQSAVAMRSMGGSSAFSHIESKLFAPVVDDVVIPATYWNALDEGLSCVTFLGGTNSGEYDRQFMMLPAENRDAAAKNMVIAHNWGKLDPQRGFSPQITEQYAALSHGAQTLVTWMDLKNDLYLRMSALACAMLASQKTTAYHYYLDYPTADGRFGHGREIPTLFYQEEELPQTVQRQLRGAWYSFVRTGDPNCPELPVQWEPFTQQNLETLHMREDARMCSGVQSQQIRLLMPLLLECRENPEFAALWQSET